MVSLWHLRYPTDKAKTILKYYELEKRSDKDFVFADLKYADPTSIKDIFRKTSTAARRFNKYLKKIVEKTGIEKNLSNHIARPSFGNIDGDKINPLMLQKLYRHSNLKTTINYQANFIHKEADDALDANIFIDLIFLDLIDHLFKLDVELYTTHEVI